MSEPTRDEIAGAELPRLRIHHFFVFTTVLAVVMSVWLGYLRLVRFLQPDAGIPEFGATLSLIFIMQSLSQSAYIGIALLGLAWRRRGISFPSQPGHWMAIYLTIAWAYESVNWLISFFLRHLPWRDSTYWLTMPMGWVFLCFTVVFWVAAFLYEPSRIWTWGWAALACKSLLAVFWRLFYIGVKCVEWVLELLWHPVDFTSQFWSFSGGPYANFMSLMLPNYLLLAFLLAATISDLRQHRQLHWSHWLVLATTFIATTIMTIYYHFVFS